MSDPVFFVSDTHFKYHSIDEYERKKRRYFLSFLKAIKGAERLYLLGDVFDFWFEYNNVIPKDYNDILIGLYDLKTGGTEIYIMGGNHDYWLGEFISGSLGLHILPSIATIELQGRRLTLTHGDTLLPGDHAYKALKTLIRSRFVIALARQVHPEILFWIARKFSRTSKGITHRKTKESAGILIGLAPDSYFKWDNDAFIMGHIHFPHIERFGNKEFVILGDWEEHCSYLRLENGKLSLEYYPRGEKTLIENR